MKKEAPTLFFEGTEKKLELVLKPNHGSLRERTPDYWASIVEACGAKILSSISNHKIDAYLLSESSLFVMDERVILITCGQTTLAKALHLLVKDVGLDRIENVFYERKNHLFPEYQRYHFFEDMKFLSESFPVKAFRFGTEDDHHLYLLHIDGAKNTPKSLDSTFELLMHGIDPKIQKLFENHSQNDREDFYKKSGMREILPDFKVDDFFFEPSGYSINAIRDSHYYTIHVTPHRIGSYVSFETNTTLDNNGLSELMGRVLEIFRPESFDLVLYESEAHLQIPPVSYRRKRHYQQELEPGYHVTFQSYYLIQEETQRATEIHFKD